MREGLSAPFVKLWRMLRPRLLPSFLAAGSVFWIALWAVGCSQIGRDADGDGVSNRADQCLHTPVGREVDARGCSDIAQALARGIDALLAERSYAVGDIWLVQQLIQLQPHGGLERLVEWWKSELAPSPFLRHIDPDAPHALLPPDPGRGTLRFYHYVLAPYGRPESRALEFLGDFVGRNETDYVLTHQFLVLVWAEEEGLPLLEAMLTIRSELLERIADEHAADTQFSDLFAERSALLLQFAEPAPGAASTWVDTLLAAQLPHGGWEDSIHSTLEFDGQRTSAVHTPAHTTALAQLALAAFLQRYASNAPVPGSHR